MIRQRAARGKEFDLSNKQIETLLARSSRAMRKHWYNRGSTVLYGPVVKNNLTTDGNVRFAVDKIDDLDIKQAFPRYTSSQAADVLITQKISSDNGTNRIYSLEVDEIVPEIKIQSEMRPDFGSQSSGQSLAHRNYPDDVINKLQAKHEKIKSFLSENLKKNNRRFSIIGEPGAFGLDGKLRQNNLSNLHTAKEIHAAALANIEQLLGKARLGVSYRDWHTYAKNQQRGANKEAAFAENQARRKAKWICEKYQP